MQLNAIREATAAESVGSIANHYRLLVALVWCRLPKEERPAFRLPSFADLETRALLDHQDPEESLFEAIMDRLGELTVILKKGGLYDWAETPVGDAGSLALGSPSPGPEDAEVPMGVEVPIVAEG